MQNLSRKFLYGTKSVNVQKKNFSYERQKQAPEGSKEFVIFLLGRKTKEIFQKHKLWSDYYRLSNGCQGITRSLELSWSNAKQTDIRNKVRQKTTSHRHLFITSLKLLTTCFINKSPCLQYHSARYCHNFPQITSFTQQLKCAYKVDDRLWMNLSRTLVRWPCLNSQTGAFESQFIFSPHWKHIAAEKSS